MIYADDTDFLSFCQDYLYGVMEVVVPLFKDEYKLIVNAEKTERTRVGHLDMDFDQSAWRGTRKLGSLLGAEEDVARSIQLANVSFGKLGALWKHRSCVAQSFKPFGYSHIERLLNLCFFTTVARGHFLLLSPIV